MRSRCERIANEILMFFRSQKKLQGEVSLSETLETDKDGNNLFLMDVVGVEDTMLDDLDTRESHIRVRQLVDECLTEREADIIRQRYGLGGKAPRTQRELAAEYGISRSYVSRRAYCKRWKILGEIGGYLLLLYLDLSNMVESYLYLVFNIIPSMMCRSITLVFYEI